MKRNDNLWTNWDSMHFPFLFLSLSSVFHLFPRQYHSLYFTLRRTKILFNVKLPNCKNARSFCLCRLYLLLVRLNRSFVSHIMIIIQQSPRNMKGEWNFRWVWSNKSLGGFFRRLLGSLRARLSFLSFQPYLAFQPTGNCASRPEYLSPARFPDFYVHNG